MARGGEVGTGGSVRVVWWVSQATVGMRWAES
jgi:hypothetical protein